MCAVQLGKMIIPVGIFSNIDKFADPRTLVHLVVAY